MTFKDHFSGHSQEYSAFRPHYPAHLFSSLASLCASHGLAWDCATGSGQAAIGLAEYFREVIATDASTAQISNAIQKAGVTYSVAHAESSGIQADSVDLITVAQALHWFDISAFSVEVNRVLKENGVLAAWTYGLITFNEGIDEVVRSLYCDIVGEFWPFERKLVEGGYSEIDLPFDEIPIADLAMTENWSFNDLLGYLNTWSASKAYAKEYGRSPLELVRNDMLQEWGDPATLRMATWPLMVRGWRKTHNEPKKAAGYRAGRV